MAMGPLWGLVVVGVFAGGFWTGVSRTAMVWAPKDEKRGCSVLYIVFCHSVFSALSHPWFAMSLEFLSFQTVGARPMCASDAATRRRWRKRASERKGDSDSSTGSEKKLPSRLTSEGDQSQRDVRCA